jgi:hypothetical protein
MSLYLDETQFLSYRDRTRIILLGGVSFFNDSLLYKTEEKPKQTIPNDTSNIEDILYVFNITYRFRNIKVTYYEVGLILSAIIFGACRCIAWGFEFPTPVEQALWRVASVFTTTAFPGYYLIWGALCRLTGLRYKTAQQVLPFTTFALYAICRFYIMAELFRSLFYLPPNAFVATWSVSIPHIG